MKKHSVLPNPAQVGTSNPTVQPGAPLRELPRFPQTLMLDLTFRTLLLVLSPRVSFWGSGGEWVGGMMSYFALVMTTMRSPFHGGEISSGHRLHAKAPERVPILCKFSTGLTPLCEPAMTECSRSWLCLTLGLSNQNLWEFSPETGPSPTSLRQVCAEFAFGDHLSCPPFLYPCSSLPSGCPASPPNPLSFLVASGSLHN